MRRWGVLAVLAVLPLLALGCGDDDDTESQAKKPGAFFGWVHGARELTAIAVDADRPDGNGRRNVRVYVCDGRGPPAGKAVWFSGTVDTKAVNRLGSGPTLTSAGGRERLSIDHFDDRVLRGSFTDAAGRRNQFTATPSTGGAGIYQVSLSEDLRYTGTSTEGDKLSARASRDGRVAGDITTAAGETIRFRIHALSLAAPADLAGSGLSEEYRRDRPRSLQPGEYVAVIAPGGSHWLGRNGDVRGGTAGNNIIGLDKAC